MKEAKLEKKYDFFEYNSELIIPKDNFEDSASSRKNSDILNSILLDSNISYHNNNLIIENSTFIIKAPDKKKIILILSIDKDLPSKVEKNIFPIHFDYPVLQAISFMNESQNESILISTGDKNNLDTIEVFQIQIKQLMHEAFYNVLKNIKNAIKIIPIKDSFVLILHYDNETYKNGGLKLWKNFKEEIYNFNKIYNFTYNNNFNKVICIDNKEAPFIYSIYNFNESHFNKRHDEKLQPDFFIQLGDHLHSIKEENIIKFLHFESIFNLIIFWVKTKKENIGFLLGIFFVNFKERKILDYVEFDFDGKNKYLFKLNKNRNEIFIFNLEKELLTIYSFSPNNNFPKEVFSSDNLFISTIKFSGNIKGIDFTANNGMVILNEQYNLICYSRNEHLFRNYQKKYKEYIQNDNDLNNNLKLKKYNSMKNFRPKKKEENNNAGNKKSKSEETQKNNLNDLINNEENINEVDKSERQKKLKEEREKRKELLNKQNELLDQLKTKFKEKAIINQLTKSFEEKLSKLEGNILSGISKSKLEEIYNQIQFINIRENKTKCEDLDFILFKANNFIFEIQSIFADIGNIKNKIIILVQNEIKWKKIEEKKDQNNCDYQSEELINNINIGLKEKLEIKNKIQKLLYDCSLVNNKINIFAKLLGISKNYEKKLNLLLLKCKNDINQINEMYKYNKFKMSKKEEIELINLLINPFIEFLEKEIKESNEKINDFIEKDESYQLNDIQTISLLNNENIFIDKNKMNFEIQLSCYFKDIFEKNNFFSLSQDIIKNHYVSLDDEFE